MVSLLGLRTLVAVVEVGSIRAAANRLGRTPSAVSMMLKQVEGGIGIAPIWWTVRGLGQVADLRSRLEHGDSPGLLTMNGNLSLDPGSTYVEQIGGTAAGTGYDQISSAAPANYGAC